MSAIEFPAPQSGSTLAICGFDERRNSANGARYGTALANLGDLDSDGCDELAVSDTKDQVGNNVGQGSVRVLWGYDANQQVSTTPVWNDINTILAANSCNNCHSYSHASLVSQGSGQVSMNLVEPGDLSNSYLLHKLNDTHLAQGGSGVQMPQNGIPLSAAEISTIEEWILAGAPETIGTAGCPGQPEVIRLTQSGASGFTGANMLGGHDFDGDGVNDILLGEPDHAVGTTVYGGITFLSGADISALPRDVISGDFSSQSATASMQSLLGTLIYNPSVPDTRFGESLALVQDASGTRVAVGAPQAMDGAGAVYLMRLVNGDWNVEMIFVGEQLSLNANFGSALASGTVNGEPALAIGASLSEGIGVDNGAVFTWTQNGGL